MLTQYLGPDRVELSGATVENWVSKTANLLVDGYDSPERVGIDLPLTWQAVCFLLGAAASGAEVSVADLTGCEVAFVSAERAQAALDEGVPDVLVVSGHPLGARLPQVPAGCLDAALEIPSYGDRFPGPFSADASVQLDGTTVEVPELGLTDQDRVLTALPLASPEGLGVLLAALSVGASLVLVSPGADATTIAAAERCTRSFPG